MDISVPPYVTLPLPKGCAFPRKRAERIIEKHDQVHDIKMDDMVVRVYAKHSDDYTDIVATCWAQGKRHLAFAYRVFSDLIDESLGDLTPGDIVTKMAERFGRDVTICGKTAKIHLPQTIPMAAGTNMTSLLAFPREPPGKDYFFVSQLFKPKSDGTIDIGLIFCFDLKRYADWFTSH